MSKITLEWFELKFASTVGIERRMESIRSKRIPMFPYSPSEYWTRDIEGACGEMALAKFLGVFWNGSVNTFKLGGDVGKIQVRTSSKESAELFVYESAKDDDIYVHIIGSAPTYDIRGFISAREAKSKEFWRADSRKPAFFVPKENLVDSIYLKDKLKFQG